MAIEQTFRVAKIVYFTDLTVAGAPVIPLGSLAEVKLAHVYALALKARVGLEPNELRAISPLIRDQVANPFAFLRREFDVAWIKAPPGQAIQFLASRHASSLSVLAPTDYSERHWLLSRLLPAREEAVEGKVSAAVDEEFADLLKRYGGHVAAPRKVIESEIREAA